MRKREVSSSGDRTRTQGKALRNGGRQIIMTEIEIYWDDLKPEKQQEILEVLGDNGNYDVIPIATLEFETDMEEGVLLQ